MSKKQSSWDKNFSNLKQLVRENLLNRYSNSFIFYEARPITLIIKHTPSVALISFKEILYIGGSDLNFRRYYRKNESKVRLKNYTEFYCSMPYPEPCYEKLDCRKIIKKRQKRLMKIEDRRRQDGSVRIMRRSKKIFLRKLENETKYIADVFVSDSENSFERSKEPKKEKMQRKKPKIIDQIREGEVWEIYPNSESISHDSELQFVSSNFRKPKRSKSIPTEISEFANISTSKIQLNNSSLSSSLILSNLLWENEQRIQPQTARNCSVLVKNSKYLDVSITPKGNCILKKHIDLSCKDKEDKSAKFGVFYRQQSSFRAKNPNPEKGSIPKISKQTVDHKSIMKVSTDWGSAATVKGQKQLKVVSSHSILVQQRKIPLKTFRKKKEIDLSQTLQAKSQMNVLLSEKFQEKMHLAAEMLTKKLGTEQKGIRVSSPETQPSKCSTERGSWLRKPASVSYHHQATSRHQAFVNSPNIFSMKGPSEISTRGQTNNIFKTLRIAHSPSSETPFREIFQTQHINSDSSRAKILFSKRSSRLDLPTSWKSGSASGTKVQIHRRNQESSKSKGRIASVCQAKVPSMGKSCSLLKKAKKSQNAVQPPGAYF